MSNIDNAFKALTELGYYAKQNHMCCSSCGWSVIPASKTKVVFYHDQDAEDLMKKGECYVAWSGDGEEIERVFNENGIRSDWNGSEQSRIKIML